MEKHSFLHRAVGINSFLAFYLLMALGCVSHLQGKKEQHGLYEGKIIDAHAHFLPKKFDIDDLALLLKKAQVSKIVLFGGEQELHAAYKKYPELVIPFLSPYIIYRETGQKKILEKHLAKIKKSLGTGFFKGYGEVLLRLHPMPFAPKGVNVPVDDPVMLKLYDMAAEFDVPVNVHVDAPYRSELERALEHNRNTKIIWAHCGYADPLIIRNMLEEHSNLFADLSILADPYKKRSRNLIHHDGSLKQEWKELFEDFSDRLMLGSDMGMGKKRYNITPKVMHNYRKLLFQLSPDAAKNIAYRTILRILTLPVE